MAFIVRQETLTFWIKEIVKWTDETTPGCFSNPKMKHQKKEKYKNSDPAKIIAKMDNRSFCPYHERFVIDEEIFVAF